MDTEMSNEVVDASEPLRPEEAVMEKEAVSCEETPKESTQPEMAAAADKEVAVNGHETQALNSEEDEVVVTEAVQTPEEQPGAEAEAEATLPAGSEMESVEKGDSSEKASGAAAASQTEAENGGFQLAAEAAPEPVHGQAPLADSAPEAEPEESGEPAPKSQQPTSQEEAAAVTESEARPQVTNVSGAGGDVPPKESQAEPEAGGDAKPATDEEEEEEEVKPEVKEAAAEEGAGEAAVTPEQSGAEPVPEETPPPTPGSLSFAFLQQETTRETLRLCRAVVVMRGLPGSGKSFLSRAIAEVYRDHCAVVCADDHGVKPESPESSADAYKALDEAVAARCGAATSSPLLLVVDDTNHTQERLARLAEIAEQHQCTAIFPEPRTDWSRDAAQLSQRSGRGLAEAQIEVMKGRLEETRLPLFFGWFLLSPAQEKIRCTSLDFLKTLDTLEAFKKHSIDFAQEAEKEVDLEQYFAAKGPLHCTTKYCDYGKADGAEEYAQNPAVAESYGSVSQLSLRALFVTPRTVGASVSLTDEQLLLWPADAEEGEEGASSLPLGSRAHVTLGCAEGVEPVQTGLDLLEILALQQGGQAGEPLEEMELGSLAYYGKGRWLLSLREPISTPACFSSAYGPKEVAPVKKAGEKKKKSKCAIL